jgi:hypothetical protein
MTTRAELFCGYCVIAKYFSDAHAVTLHVVAGSINQNNKGRMTKLLWLSFPRKWESTLLYGKNGFPLAQGALL